MITSVLRGASTTKLVLNRPIPQPGSRVTRMSIRPVSRFNTSRSSRGETKGKPRPLMVERKCRRPVSFPSMTRTFPFSVTNTMRATKGHLSMGTTHPRLDSMGSRARYPPAISRMAARAAPQIA